MLYLLSFYQHNLTLWLSNILRAFIRHHHIFFQTKIAIIRHSQPWLDRIDLPDFQFLIGRVAILLPQRTQQRAAVVCDASELVAERVGIFGVT